VAIAAMAQKFSLLEPCIVIVLPPKWNGSSEIAPVTPCLLQWWVLQVADAKEMRRLLS
jgi:hypothetical protein